MRRPLASGSVGRRTPKCDGNGVLRPLTLARAPACSEGASAEAQRSRARRRFEGASAEVPSRTEHRRCECAPAEAQRPTARRRFTAGSAAVPSRTRQRRFQGAPADAERLTARRRSSADSAEGRRRAARRRSKPVRLRAKAGGAATVGTHVGRGAEGCWDRACLEVCRPRCGGRSGGKSLLRP